MAYLLKVTVAWALFLLLFEALYKGNGKFAVNRFYLLFSIAAGLLLPLIPLPSGVPAVVSTTQAFYPKVLSAAPGIATGTTVATIATPSTVVVENSLDGWQILRIVYLIGIALLLLRFLLESARMMRLILHSPRQTVAGHEVIVTGRQHAPYSFMGWIFISQLGIYQPTELEYIIRHEAAHNARKHWLDLLLLQLTCVTLWFHPLIWRYRYLLQLQHEYEADDLAAHNDAYAYGHFLLQQTLLNGVPSVAHSFHFSPIKNRIKMLTKKQNQRTGTWTYLLAIPALLGCTLLIAKANAKADDRRQGAATVYNGNTFMWRQTDTLFYDKEKKQTVTAKGDDRFKKQIIYEMNEEPVYRNEYVEQPATYSGTEMEYAEYLRKEFSALCKNSPDSQAVFNLMDIVVDKEGKVVCYNVRYFRPFSQYRQDQWYPYPVQEPRLNSILNKIITAGPRWKPAKVNGQAVNSIVNYATNTGC